MKLPCVKAHSLHTRAISSVFPPSELVADRSDSVGLLSDAAVTIVGHDAPGLALAVLFRINPDPVLKLLSDSALRSSRIAIRLRFWHISRCLDFWVFPATACIVCCLASLLRVLSERLFLMPTGLLMRTQVI